VAVIQEVLVELMPAIEFAKSKVMFSLW
jgi:hypothetical protein